MLGGDEIIILWQAAQFLTAAQCDAWPGAAASVEKDPVPIAYGTSRHSFPETRYFGLFEKTTTEKSLLPCGRLAESVDSTTARASTTRTCGGKRELCGSQLMAYSSFRHFSSGAAPVQIASVLAPALWTPCLHFTAMESLRKSLPIHRNLSRPQ